LNKPFSIKQRPIQSTHSKGLSKKYGKHHIECGFGDKWIDNIYGILIGEHI